MRFVPLLGLLFCVAALAQAPVAGFTSGSLRVTESGAAEYRIPLRVPPGIAGLEPKLALVYNSQAGNGPFGVGWNLEGLSAITRCARTMAQDGARGGVSYDGGDRFCLDGQRLVAIGGAYGESETEYRTERESFSKIVSYGQAGSGPAWFKVRTKAGHVMEYGRTEDSRIQAHLKEAVRVWAVNRISDQNGNDLTVAYNEDGANGEFYPLRIDYAGNGGAAAASVRFVPEARPDVATAYVARSVVRTLSRIAGITTYLTTDTADVLIKDYRLSYVQPSSTQRSVVATVTECGSGQGCLPGIQVGTSADSGPVFGHWSWINAIPMINWDASGLKSFLADVNGDGRADLVHTQHGYFYVGLSEGTGFGHWSWSSAIPMINWDAAGVQSFLADVNGDGRADLVHTQHGTFYVGLSDGLGFGHWSWSSPMPMINWDAPGAKSFLADVNGDGRADLVHTQNGSFYVGLSDGLGFGHWSWINPMPMINWDAPGAKSFLADVNGDGRADLVHTQNGSFYVGLSDGLGFGHWSWINPMPMINWDAPGAKSFLADVNGDGRADLVHTQNGSFYVGLSDGLGFGHWSWINPIPMINWDANGVNSFLADVNGDGRADLVHTQNGSFYVGLSDGLGFGHWSWINPIPMINWDANGVNSFLADVNGDGRADLVHTQNGSFYVGSRSDPLPDLAASVTDSLLRTHSIAYKPLTDGAVYAKDSGVDAASYPNLDLQPALHVVHSIASSSGAGGVRTTTHKYGGLKASHEGRGSLGFRWQDSYQTVDGTQLRTRAEFRQDWPYLGLTSVVRKSRGADALLGQVTNQYDCRDPLSGNACTVTAGNRFFPFVWRSVESGADLNGAALPTVTTDTQYDGAGNPTRVEVSTPDGYRKTTTNSYAPPDTANWRLGRLLRSTVESASP
jgi:hypothetical protein